MPDHDKESDTHTFTTAELNEISQGFVTLGRDAALGLINFEIDVLKKMLGSSTAPLSIRHSISSLELLRNSVGMLSAAMIIHAFKKSQWR